VSGAKLPEVRVVGLGPGDESLMTARTIELMANAAVARLRTRVHPAAERYVDTPSYDEWYEDSDSFEALYARIVEDLAALARSHGRVVYAVPGSPIVAERTVELLMARDDVEVIIEPAVSVIDVACATLRVDPMAAGLRVVDALSSSEALRGPGPLLVLQTYAPEVLAVVSDRLDPETMVTVLHHLGLSDQHVTRLPARSLASFTHADHLTSLWVSEVADASSSIAALVAVTKRLRAECPWDQEQTHASLTRHLLEEAYEALDALEAMVRAETGEGELDERVSHVEEELGDLLFQVIIHAEIASEEDRFDLASIADTLRAKLIYRHPHVFGDASLTTADEVAARWEVLKRDEKGRVSVTDGIAWQLPALTLYTKLLRKAVQVGVALESGEEARADARRALGALPLFEARANDATSSANVDATWGEMLAALVTLAHYAGVDLEGVLRHEASALRDEILAHESPTGVRKDDD